MWSMEPNEINSQIYNYKIGSFFSLNHKRYDTCEKVCKDLCRLWNFPPLVQLLFGLRIHGKQIWLADSRTLVKGEKYEFRIRFKIPKLSDLNQLNREAFDYLYHQMVYDVQMDAIPEVQYPKYKDPILGLSVSSMLVDMIENGRDVDYYKRNAKHFIPRKLWKEHSIFGIVSFAKEESLDALKKMSKKDDCDPLYIKTIYIRQIESKAPNYIIEEYTGTIEYPKEDGLKRGQCRVRFQIAPYHQEQPGLRVLYEYKGTWKHVANFADFYTIQIDRDANVVTLEIQTSNVGVKITMENNDIMESFVSCLCTYYRLTTKWDTDLCTMLSSPSLKDLNDLKIHGPIGGTYSYSKLEDRNSDVGTFIIRQCEMSYETFYIDIMTKENQTETFKIRYDAKDVDGCKWKLIKNDNDVGNKFPDLIALAKSIPLDGGSERYFRLQPSPHDKSPLLLLCHTSAKMMSTTAAMSTKSPGLNGKNPLLINAAEDLLLYKKEQRDYSDRIFTRMKAELNQSIGRKKTKVTLKILKQSEVSIRLTDFCKLADWWGKLDLSEIVRLHGITLHQPVALVLESISHGPLDEFLRSNKDTISLLNLVEAAISMAKALHYLQENQLVHGRIRCSTLEVTKFSQDREFVVKLGDPGISTEYNINDVPWIPIEHYENLSESKKNLKADIWAYATTLWEIFSRGSSPLFVLNHAQIMNLFKSSKGLPKPSECNALPAIQNLMMRGWDNDPDKRPQAQIICATLVDTKTELSRNYEEPTINDVLTKPNGVVPNGRHSRNNDDYKNISIRSAETEGTYIHTTTTATVYTDNGSSSNGGSSQQSLISENSPNGSGTSLDITNYDDFFDDYLSASTGVLELYPNTRLIFQGEAGRGNHGLVYRGSLETNDENGIREVKVAIKRLLHINTNDIETFRDFIKEAKLMKKLQHENIVKIYGFSDKPLIIIMEYMPMSLLRYLNIYKSGLRVENLLHFAEDIAKGMCFLEQNKIVHRDLAARNVLVKCDNVFNATCKIADFGLAQATDKNGYYVYSRSRYLPLKWYAPECIGDNKFSSKSDVWSYAVTLFEMFSFGDSPNLVNDESLMKVGEEILRLLKSGVRLQRPPFCPLHVYEDLMMPCWNDISQKRPSFAAILQRFPSLSREAV